MAFRSANVAAHMIKFNSAASSDFLAMYSDLIDAEISNKNNQPAHKTFAPSQMRCDRVSWFRLRGTEPDHIADPDKGINFTAEVGTACHEIVQNRLTKALGNDWIDVHKWIDEHAEYFVDYDMDITSKGYESMIDLRHPYPVRFACDGVIRFNGTIFLLEIKTVEFSALNNLTRPMEKHMDQIKCYATLLHIPNVLFLYIDRNYGDMKCFEVTVTEDEQATVLSKMNKVLEAVESNIPPEGLPAGDPNCSSSTCKYYKKCKSWGR